MNREFYIDELKRHIDYHTALLGEMDRLSEESTKLVEKQAGRRTAGEELERDAFVAIDLNGFKANAINADLLKTEARIRLILSYAVNEGYDVEKGLPPAYVRPLQAIAFSSEQSPEFLFVAKDGEVSYASDEMESLIREAAEQRAGSLDLDAALNAFVKQYEDYVKRTNHPKDAKEADKG